MDNRAEVREFLATGAAHDVHVHVTGSKVFRHPVVGELHHAFTTLPLPGDHGLSLTVYTPEPGTGADERLALLASWTATPAAAPSGDRAQAAVPASTETTR